MAVGIYGGSFDPIHFGHLITTQSVFEKRGLDKILFIPSHISPLKQDICATDDYHRFKMAELALSPFPFFEVSDFEIKKNDVSYTIDSLRYFKNFYDEIELIIGFDNLAVFDKWQNPDEIFEIAKVIVMMRHMDNIQTGRNKYFEKAILIDTPNIEISSTDIRSRIKENLPIDYLVPTAVKEYISKNNLYR
jgi:nicotinate-nucleotide adenylyltransferase